MRPALKGFQKLIVLFLVSSLGSAPAWAGMTIDAASGITMTGADGVVYHSPSGIAMTGADGILTYGVNGITMTGADGITMTGADGLGAMEPNAVNAVRADGITMTGADGITMTGADGITMTGADGTAYRADSVIVNQPTGITMTGADGIAMTGVNAVNETGPSGVTMTGADGIHLKAADGVTMNGAESLLAIAPNGEVFSVSPNGLNLTGVNGVTVAGADGITMTGADGITMTGADGTPMTAAGNKQSGLQSVDPELALQLDRLTDDSNVNAVIVYHRLPGDGDLADLNRLGIDGGTRYRALPMIAVTATRARILAVSQLPNVRSVYGNRTLQLSLAPGDRTLTGVDRVGRDSDLTQNNSGAPLSGRGVTVAVLDTGVDATHGDLAGRVVQNVKLADTQSISAGFTAPAAAENVPNTDQAYGHGTFVAGVIAGNGNHSGGKYSGVAPGARLVGLSAGDLTLSFVLAGFDYLLSRGSDFNVRVVNCSFSANTVFDLNDPVNVATKMLADSGVNVVFSAGNNGPGAHTLNPYAVAPWVIGVGATDARGRLADFSSRGDFGSPLFHPALVAPGVSAVGLRSSGASVTGGSGLTAGDGNQLSSNELPFYTTDSGTSFSAPQVAGTIALMLEANPALRPAQVRDILKRSATPLPSYYQYEAGAGMLNAHAAVLEAAFPRRRMGVFRALLSQGQVRFINDPARQFTSTVLPGNGIDADVTIPVNTVRGSVRIAWGPMWSVNNLGLSIYDAAGAQRGDAETINVPGLTGKSQGISLNTPPAGTWRAHVWNILSPAGTPQPVAGLTQVTRAQYAAMPDLAMLPEGSRAEIYQTVRTFVMWPFGNHFCPSSAVSRAELARALLLGGRVPQYISDHSRYADVRGAAPTLAVDSAQACPGGALFPDASPGGPFHPADAVSRLSAAIALVRAAGLRAQAENWQSGGPTFMTNTAGLADLDMIPAPSRGYVAVALSDGLLTPENGAFHPRSALTRAELAHAMVALENLAVH